MLQGPDRLGSVVSPLSNFSDRRSTRLLRLFKLPALRLRLLRRDPGRLHGCNLTGKYVVTTVGGWGGRGRWDKWTDLPCGDATVGPTREKTPGVPPGAPLPVLKPAPMIQTDPLKSR